MKMEMKNEVKTYQTRFLCESCLKDTGLAGEFFPTGKIFFSNPPKHEHKCNKCEATKALDKLYPNTEYEIVSEW